MAGVGGNILVGAHQDDPAGDGSRPAYLFDGVTGALLLTIPNPAPVADDSFGSTVAGVGGNILVAAYADDPGGVTDAGSAYLFDGATGALLPDHSQPHPATSESFGSTVAGFGGNIRWARPMTTRAAS